MAKPLTLADIRRVQALMDAQPNPESYHLPLEVWLFMNAIADSLDGGDTHEVTHG